MIEHFAHAFKLGVFKEIEQSVSENYADWAVGTYDKPDNFPAGGKSLKFWDCISPAIADDIHNELIKKGMTTENKGKAGRYLCIYKS